MRESICLLLLVLYISSVRALAGPWEMRNDDGQYQMAIQQRVQNADVIVCGIAERAVGLTNGAASFEGREVTGAWAEVSYRVDRVLKGSLVEGKLLQVRFFMAGRGAGAFFYPIPDAQRCLLFLRKDEEKGVFAMEPSRDPILALPKSVADVDPTAGIQDRLRSVLADALKQEDAVNPAGILDMLLGLTSPKTRLEQLVHLSAEPTTGIRCVILAYRLALGDIGVCKEIDDLLQAGALSAEEMQTVAQSLMEQKDPRLKPFLLKWIEHSDPSLRGSAWRTVVTYEDASLIPVLIHALDQSDSLTRRRALRTLRNVAGEQRPSETDGFVASNTTEQVQAWKAWWEKKARHQDK